MIPSIQPAMHYKLVSGLALATVASMSVASVAFVQAPPSASPAAEKTKEPYPLDTCPVSGKKLGMMGDPVLYDYEGREIRFCCKDCIRDFEASPEKYVSEINAQIIKEQLPFYPSDTCVVSGEELGGDMGEPVNYVYNNRLVRFCCKSCIRGFNREPAKYLAQLDELVLKQQQDDYPLKTCVVSGEELGGDMGQPVERIYANHLVRFCCKSCIKKFEKDPTMYLGKIDEAWGEKKPGPAHIGEGEDHQQDRDRDDDHGGEANSHGGHDGHGH